jgi:hypothetical protein
MSSTSREIGFKDSRNSGFFTSKAKAEEKKLQAALE